MTTRHSPPPALPKAISFALALVCFRRAAETNRESDSRYLIVGHPRRAGSRDQRVDVMARSTHVGGRA